MAVLPAGQNATPTRQTILEVKAWVPGKLLSIKTTRDPGFRFTAGQFARLGLPEEPDSTTPTLWRAYSMVSAPHEPYLEFYSIVVPEGAFSPRLAHLREGDPLYLDPAPYGFLTLDRFAPEGDLWLLCTGTGLSAYLSMLREDNIWQRHPRIILAHGVRNADELAYADEIRALAARRAAVDAARPAPLVYLPLPTRDALPGLPMARITTLLADGRLETLAGQALDPSHSKVMLCGNPAMVTEARQLLQARGFAAGRRGKPGNLAVENYW